MFNQTYITSILIRLLSSSVQVWVVFSCFSFLGTDLCLTYCFLPIFTVAVHQCYKHCQTQSTIQYVLSRLGYPCGLSLFLPLAWQRLELQKRNSLGSWGGVWKAMDADSSGRGPPGGFGRGPTGTGVPFSAETQGGKGWTTSSKCHNKNEPFSTILLRCRILTLTTLTPLLIIKIHMPPTNIMHNWTIILPIIS